MKRLAPLLLGLLMAAPAFAGAGSLLFDDGRWRVFGVPSGMDPLPITVTQNKTTLGTFSSLSFLFDKGGVFVLVLTLDSDGTIQPSVPSGVPGAVAQLTRYFECETGLTDPIRFTAIELPKKTSNDFMKLKGEASNFDSLVTDKLKIYVIRPDNNLMDVEFQYKLKATRDICVDQARHETDEEFRIFQIDSRFVSAGNQLNDLARFTKNIDVDCNVFGDCNLDRVRECAPLSNTTGYIFDSPNRLADRRIELFHTTETPAATPTLDAILFSPAPNRVKPQGFVTESDDLSLNVSLWGNWVDADKTYKTGKTIGSFDFAIEADKPDQAGCDRIQ